MTDDSPTESSAESPTLPRAPAAEELASGAQLGRYVIRARVGAGGMGVVYAAHDPLLDRALALKVLRGRPWGSAEEMAGRIVREAQALARLTHPNVVTVHDLGRAGDRLFIAMELVDGVTADEWLRARPRGWAEVLELYLRAGDGLAAAHAVGLVHRDVKPGNVLVATDGRVRVTDFGLARLFDARRVELAAAEPFAPAVTADGAILGSPGYMAPEQMTRGAEVGAPCDVFSFCVSLHEGLYGRRPFRGRSLEEIAAAIARRELAPVDASVPDWLRAIVLTGLEPAPEARPTMRALLDALERGRMRHGLSRAERVLAEAGELIADDTAFVKVAVRLMRDFVDDQAHHELAPPAALAADAADEVGPDAPILAAVEIHGAHAQALLGRFGYQALVSHFILREGLGEAFDPQAWYPALPLVRAAHHLVDELGPRVAFDPGRIARDRTGGDLVAMLGALDATYHRSFRLHGAPLVDEQGAPRPGIGRYLVEPGGAEIAVTATGPWPCAFDRAVVTGVALRAEPDAIVEHGAGDPCRGRGDRRCVYRVRRGRGLRAFRGSSHVCWSADAQLGGAAVWGRPTAGDLEALIRDFSRLRPRALVLDVRRVDEIAAETFAALQALLGAGRAAPGRLEALAVVRAPTMPGAVVTGVLEMAAVPYQVRCFAAVPEALAWLGRAEPWLLEALDGW
jgi:hypothetical protein